MLIFEKYKKLTYYQENNNILYQTMYYLGVFVMAKNEYKIIPVFTNEHKRYEDILNNAIKNYLKINNFVENNRVVNKNNVKYNSSK